MRTSDDFVDCRVRFFLKFFIAAIRSWTHARAHTVIAQVEVGVVAEWVPAHGMHALQGGHFCRAEVDVPA